MTPASRRRWCEADAARLRPAGRAGCFIASVTASCRLQFATRCIAVHCRQAARRFGFGTRDRPHSSAKERQADVRRAIPSVATRRASTLPSRS